MNMTLLYLLFSHLRPLKHVQHVWNWWLEKENEKVGETVREAWGQFAAALQQGRTFFISHRVKKSPGNWKRDGPAANTPQMPMESFGGIRLLHRGLPLYFFHIRAYGKMVFNGNAWKGFPLFVSCISVSAQMKLYRFCLDWVMPKTGWGKRNAKCSPSQMAETVSCKKQT